MSITNSKIYYINTENKLSGTSSRFSYSIPIPVGSEFDRCVVLQCAVPISFYLVQDGFNQFLLTETIKGTVNTTVITIPPGNYDYVTFANIITTLLNKASSLAYTVTFLEAQLKYSFSTTNDAGEQITFTFNSHLSQQFGFDKHSVNNFPILGNDSLVSANLLNFATEGTIFIHSDITNELTDVLQEIYTTSTNSIISYQLTTSIDAYSKKLRTTGSNVFNFYITNEEDEELRLQGQDCLITLLLYKSDNFTEMFRKFVSWSIQSQDEKNNKYNKQNMEVRNI